LTFGAGAGISQTLTDGPTVATNVDGRLELFARASDGSPWHAWQNSPGGSWTGWYSLGGVITGAPVPITNADGRLEIFGMAGGGVYHNYQTAPGGGWSGWIWIGGSISSPPTVAMNFDGRLELFARGADGAGWTASQVIPGGTVWTAWTSFGGGIMRSPSVIENADGRLEIFALGGGNTVFHLWQQTPGGQWSGWSALTGASIATSPTVAINNDGRLEVFAQGTDNAGWHIWQITPGAGWSAWASLGGIITGSPNGDLDGSGNINIFVVNPNSNPFYNTQANGWAGWTFLGGAIMYAPSIGLNFDGRQEIFGLTGAGVYHNWQLSPGGPWSGWALLGTPSNSGDTNSTNLPWILTAPQNDSNYQSAITDPANIPPPWNLTQTAWPCGARVNIGLSGFKTKNLRWAGTAVANWNTGLLRYYSAHYSASVVPVQLYISSGGPQSVYVHTVGDNSIPSKDPKHPNSYARGITGRWAPDASDRLLSADTSIIEGMTDSQALTNTLAHELGHTFGLADCYQCGTVNLTNKFVHSYTVMDSDEPVPTTESNGWDRFAKNFPEALAGPNDRDISVIDSHLPDYANCIAEDAPPPAQPTCTNGTAVGFMDTGQTSQYTCNGTACDGCNSACSNFAPQKCPTSGGGGTGGSGGTCKTWCGNICMDTAVCSCPGETPSCQENSGGWFPNCNNSCSPIVVDAFDEGFHLTDMGHGVKFRVKPDGPLLQMSWPDQEYRNGWLALDRNGNGTIDDFTELFGNMTPQPSSDDPNGYHALAIFDDPMNGGNGNGVIDPGDAVYDQLKLWIDTNHNGISEPEELHSLAEMGIFRIDLKYHLLKYVDANGNSFRYRSRIWDDAGHGHDVCYDVFLSVEPLNLSGSH